MDTLFGIAATEIGRKMETPEQHQLRLRSDAAWCSLSLAKVTKRTGLIATACEGPQPADDPTLHGSRFLTW